jgi:MFS family permease
VLILPDSAPLAQSRQRSVFGAPITAWASLVLLFAITVLAYSDRFVFNLLAQMVQHDLQLSDSRFGLIQGSAFALSYSAAAFLLIRWADDLPSRTMLMAAVIVWSIGTVLCGLADSFNTLFAARALVGIGEAALFPATIPIVARLFPAGRRGLAISLLLVANFAASGVALVVTGALLHALQELKASGYLHGWNVASWRMVLVILGLPATIAAPAVALIPAGSNQRDVPNASAALVGPSREDRRVLATILVGLTLWALVDYSLNAWLPTDLMRSFAATPGEISRQLGVASVSAGVLGPLLGGLLGDRLERSRAPAPRMLIGLIFGTLAVPLTLCALLPALSQRIDVFAAYTLATGIAWTTIVAAMQDLATPLYRGRVMALQGFLCTAIGMGTGPYLVARLSESLADDGTGLSLALALFNVPMLAASTLALFIAWQRLRHSRPAISANFPKRVERDQQSA